MAEDKPRNAEYCRVEEKFAFSILISNIFSCL